MPLVIPSALIAEKNLLYSAGGFLELLQIEISELSETVRIVNNNEDISWGGYTWNKFQFEPGDVKENQEGEAPRVVVKVSNVRRALQTRIEQTENQLVGDSVIYYLIHSDHLGEAAVITLNLNVLYAEADPMWVTFYLGAENFFLKRFPLNTFSRDFCRYVHDFGGARCGYSGVEATCDGRFTTCISYENQSRYGNCPALPGGGFTVLEIIEVESSSSSSESSESSSSSSQSSGSSESSSSSSESSSSSSA